MRPIGHRALLVRRKADRRAQLEDPRCRAHHPRVERQEDREAVEEALGGERRVAGLLRRRAADPVEVEHHLDAVALLDLRAVLDHPLRELMDDQDLRRQVLAPRRSGRCAPRSR